MNQVEKTGKNKQNVWLSEKNKNFKKDKNLILQINCHVYPFFIESNPELSTSIVYI